jgi:hypothetical protein
MVLEWGVFHSGYNVAARKSVNHRLLLRLNSRHNNGVESDLSQNIVLEK